MPALPVPQANRPAPPDSTPGSPDFAALVRVTLRSVAESSARVYGQTYALWRGWCKANGLDPLALLSPNVGDFLEAQPVSKATRQRMLSALRSLAQMLAVADYENPARRAAYETLLRMKTPTTGCTGSERPRTAHTREEVYALLNVWRGQPTHQAARNTALLAVMFYTGMRRSEIAALRWQEIDLTNGVIHVAHGKGGKRRDVAVYGETAIRALRRWRARCPGREYVFCAINKGDNLGKRDAPMSDTSLYRQYKATCQAAGVESKPHDARRTLATDLLVNGEAVHNVQAQLGHARAETTLEHYAMPVDARRRRERGRLSY